MNPVVRLVLAIALAGALVVGLAVSLLQGSGTKSQAATGPPGFFGIVQGIRLDQNDFHTMQTAGVASDRFLLFWGAVQPRPGSFVWGPTDRLVGGFAASGVRPFPDLSGNPDWVAGGPSRPPLDTPQAEAQWQAFVKAVVGRYGPGGTYWAHAYRRQFPNAKPLPITAWQVWNEPNLSKYFAPKPSATEYARLLQISQGAIKGINPHAQVVLAGMPGKGDVDAWKFVQSLYSVHGFASDFDIAALHPYATNVGALADQVKRVRAVMDQNGGKATPLWLTEFGWGSGRPDRFGLSKGPVGQAQLLTAAFNLILANRQAWNVQRAFWFDWRDPSNPQAGRCSFCATAGLLNYNRSPKPAYFAYRRFASAQ